MKSTIKLLILLAISTTARADLLDLRSNVFHILVPKGWLQRSWNEPGNGRIMILVPKDDAHAMCVIDFRGLTNFEPVSREDVEEWIREHAKPVVGQSVEKQISLKSVEVANGFGMYCVFSDALLVGKPVQQDDYKVLALATLRLGSDVVADATLFCDDQKAPEFAIMLKALSSITVTRKK